MLCKDVRNLFSVNDLMLLDGRKLLDLMMLCRDGRILFANDPFGLFSRVGPAEMT